MNAPCLIDTDVLRRRIAAIIEHLTPALNEFTIDVTGLENMQFPVFLGDLDALAGCVSALGLHADAVQLRRGRARLLTWWLDLAAIAASANDTEMFAQYEQLCGRVHIPGGGQERAEAIDYRASCITGTVHLLRNQVGEISACLDGLAAEHSQPAKKKKRRGGQQVHSDAEDRRVVADWEASGLKKHELEERRGWDQGCIARAQDRIRHRN